MSFAKALENVVGWSRRRHPLRINRRLDDRDNVLFEAMANLEGRSSTIYPTVQSMPATFTDPSIGAGAVTGIALTGVNLLGDATKSTGATADSAGGITFEAVLPGEQDIAVTFVTTGGGAAVITADVSAGTIEVESDGAQTDDAVATAINNDPIAKFMVEATSLSAGAMDADEVVTVTGGTGTLPTLSIGGNAMDGTVTGNGITAMDATSITLDLDVSGGGHGLLATEVHLWEMTIDGVSVPLPFAKIAA
jgi:hypothetical protein